VAVHPAWAVAENVCHRERLGEREGERERGRERESAREREGEGNGESERESERDGEEARDMQRIRDRRVDSDRAWAVSQGPTGEDMAPLTGDRAPPAEP
jgi:hypothetical protein